MATWRTLKTDDGAQFDVELNYNAADIMPMVTYGTNPGMGIGIGEHVPNLSEVPAHELASYTKSLAYMGLEPGMELRNKAVDYVFIGSCTNARIEDLRVVAEYVRGKQKAEGVEVWIVPGSVQVSNQAKAEGLEQVFIDAGFELRQPGCSACLGMNEDKIPAGKYCISTSNRNFEGRQGPGSRTFLASPIMAAAAAVAGRVVDVRELM